MEEFSSRANTDPNATIAEDKRALTSKLEDKVIVVTGGSRGLGKAIAEAFAEHAAHVIVASRSKPELQQVKHDRLTWMPVDVTELESVSALERHIRGTWGRLDVLVNNAGAVTKEQPMMEAPISDLLNVIDVNLKGPLLTSRLLVPLMKGRSGMVINVGSSAGRTLRPGMDPYGTTKAGLRHHSARLGLELADLQGFANVRVFIVDPGAMDTVMRHVVYPEETDKSTVADPRNVAQFFIRLAADRIVTDVETGKPLRNGQELVVKRYMPELWPEGSRISRGEQQGRVYS